MTSSALRLAIIIPARYGSKRVPAKPMAMIAGRSLLHRVWGMCQSISNVAGVWVATDDERVAEHARSFGAQVVMTPVDCQNGTERTAAALTALGSGIDAAVNVQGDAVLTPPWVVQALVDAMHADDISPMVTPAVCLDRARWLEFIESKKQAPSSGTTVVCDAQGRAMYFSKTVLPFVREPDVFFPKIMRHIGLYGYRREALMRLAALPMSELERSESLEQLRALEAGIPIRVVEVDYRGRTHWSIDNPEDIGIVESIIAREGELIPHA